MSAQKKLLLALLALVAVFVTGTVGYYLIEEQVSLPSAAYMTLITLSTVGFSEQWTLTPAGKTWTSLIIIFGILVVTVAFASLQAMIAGGELRHVLGRRQLKDRIGKLSSHYIVCGYGRMGGQISRSLHDRGKKVVVIDRDATRTAAVHEAGLDYVLGDASSEESLREARIDRAAGLVSVLRSDADNVFVTLTARGLHEDLPIIARAENRESEAKLKRAGATRAICPHDIGANRIVNLLARPAVARLVDITMGGTDWEIEEVRVPSDSKLVGRTLQELNLREQVNATVVAIHAPDGRTTVNPGPTARINAGDTMVVIGPAGTADSLAAFGLGSEH